MPFPSFRRTPRIPRCPSCRRAVKGRFRKITEEPDAVCAPEGRPWRCRRRPRPGQRGGPNTVPVRPAMRSREEPPVDESNDKAAARPVATGIPGLDDVLGGGFTPNRVYLIEGNPGSGKTTLALQCLLEG